MNEWKPMYSVLDANSIRRECKPFTKWDHFWMLLFAALVTFWCIYYENQKKANLEQETRQKEAVWQEQGRLVETLPSKAIQVRTSQTWNSSPRTVVVLEDGTVWKAYKGGWKKMGK